MGGSTGTLSLFFPVFVPVGLAATAYAGHRAYYVDWRLRARHFLTAPGRTSRILLLIFIILNWKSLPFAWTVSLSRHFPISRPSGLLITPQVRLFHSFFYQLVRRPKKLPQQALFHFSVTTCRNSILDTDYNMHKSNSTYFADLDVSRSHLTTHLLGPSMFLVGDNAKNKLVVDK